MTPADYGVEAFAAIRANKLRSALTALGVIIGVASIIVMGAIVAGAQANVEHEIRFFGVNVLSVKANAAANAESTGRSVVLTEDDLQALGELPDVEDVTGMLLASLKVAAGDASWKTSVMGLDGASADVYRYEMREGRIVDAEDVASGAKVVTLSDSVARRLFGEERALGREVRVGAVPMRVIGVQAPVGKIGGEVQDDLVYVPLSTARARLSRAENAPPRELHWIAVKFAEGTDMAEASEAVDALLRARKHIAADEQAKFDVINMAKFMQLLNAAQTTFSWLLAATAAIALIVGGVGIMNIMLVSVTERTHEIGLRKALGAKERDILIQFLYEAVFLCVAAGLLGLLIGLAGAYAAAAIADWPVAIGGWMILTALIASIGVGVTFGYVPARNAARLDPVEALARD
jgi:putative ABC transport system permease protein